MITLENKNLILSFDETGALHRFYSKLSGWEITNNTGHTEIFRLMLPLENFYKEGKLFTSKRNNMACGVQQKPPRVQADESCVVFTWDTIQSQFGGTHDITVTARISIDDNAVFFAMEINNRSNVTVENAYYPCFSPFCLPDKKEQFELFTRVYSSAQRIPIFPKFANLHGYYGIDTPTMCVGSNPQIPYVLLRNEKQGLAVMIGERSFDPLFYKLTLNPGYGESMGSWWPEEDTIGGKEVYAEFSPGQLSFIAPGETRSLVPVMMQPYVGDWTAGMDIYRKRRSMYFAKSTPPAWIDKPHSWLQCHINSPEDELRMRFTELPALAKECKDAGIAAIQLVGWNDGGQDQGNPCHDPDPRLGTFEELKAAIAECAKIGVHIILFSKFNWADEGRADYHQNLKQYTVKDPFGNPAYFKGYQYQSLSQLADTRVKRLIPLCFNHEGTMHLLKQEFNKMIALGAQGTLYDECFHHWPSWLCFDKNHTHKRPAPTQGMDLEFPKMMLKDAPKDFAMCGEALYDGMFEEYHVSYFRSEDENLVPLERYVANDCRIMTSVVGFHDRNMINQCLMYNFIISYEPYNFKGKPTDFPLTIAYGKQMHALREELCDYVWDGEFLHTKGAQVKQASGAPHAPYSVFRNQKNNKLAAVITNYKNEPVDVTVCFDQAEIEKYRLVDGAWEAYNGSLTLPPHSAAVVLQK